MLKDQVITELKALRLPHDSYVVLMGASLCVRGLRDSGDIDILVDGSLRGQLLELGFKEELLYSQGGVGRRYARGAIKVFDHFLHIGSFADFREYFSASEDVEGIPFVSLRDVLTIKQRFGRDKDMRDLALISAHLSNYSFRFHYDTRCCL